MDIRRIGVFDYMKGVAIMSVIAIHCSGGLGGASYMSLDAQFGLIIRQALNYSVPVFLFISGYLSYNDNIFSALYLIKRIVRIATPFLFWSTIYIAFRAFVSRSPIEIEELLIDISTGNSIVVGYFVIVLLQYTLISPLLNSIKSNKKHVAILLFATLLGLVYTYIIQIFYPNSDISKFPYYSLPFIVWYPFFHMGLLIHKTKPLINNKTSVFFAILGFVASISEGYLLYNNINYSFAVSQIKLTSILFSISICLLISANIDKKINDGLITKIGGISYGIYLSHVLIMMILSKLFSYFIFNQNSITFFMILFISTSVVSISFAFTAKRMMPKVIHKYTMG